MNQIKNTLLLFSLLFFCGNLTAQININTQGTVNTCAGTWTDSGGTGNYNNNENFTQTLCPDTPGEVLKVTFTSFSTENGFDFLSYYDDDAATPANILGTDSGTSLQGVSITGNITTDNPNGCLTFTFTSDASSSRPGWEATVSCVAPCSNPTAEMTSSDDALVCSADALVPGSPVSFDASGSTAAAGFNIVAYDWIFGDGTTETTATATTTHTYTTSGLFVAFVSVRDDNTDIEPDGCNSTNTANRIVFVTATPDCTGTSENISIAAGGTVTLDGVATSVELIQELPSVNIPPTAVPDVVNSPFDVELDYRGFFPDGATVTAGCIPSLCVNIEHDFANDLTIDLIAPDGTTVRMFNRGNGGAHFGDCVNTLDDGLPGCTAQYCFEDGSTNDIGSVATIPSPDITCPAYSGDCAVGSYIPTGTYAPNQAFSGFIGAPLNGIWTIRVQDNAGSDDGSIDAANLTFPASCYNPLIGFTPDLNTDATTAWTADPGNPSVITIPPQTNSSVLYTASDPRCGNITPLDGCEGNTVTNTITVGPFNTGGDYTFTYTVTDELGCQYEKSVVVTVSACEATNGVISITTN